MDKKLHKEKESEKRGEQRAKKQNDSRAVYIASSKSCEPKRLVRCWNKFERKHIREQQPNQFHCCNQNMGFANRMDQNVAKYRIGIRMKKWWWFPFFWMLDVFLQWAQVLHCINWDKGDKPLPLLAFRIDFVGAIFLEYSKEGK